MKKTENEFGQAIDELEEKVEKLNEKKKIESRRLKKVEAIINQKNE